MAIVSIQALTMRTHPPNGQLSGFATAFQER
jgi:hypothetical protein